ncbi:MAG: hypothetical protein WC554_15370 [Clostridia bacterium]|jgi:hypothetical protein|nr:hypothetical protein [Clostridia bacterium]MDD4502637.1 hypothetical protein [Clostridia bacterium]OQB51901.1 MAG: hypothetical protein BWX97_01780 [Firmicutes bacterium ADurb.Bin146]
MLIHDKNLGHIKLQDIPVPDGAYDFFGTYTYSGRVLVSYHSVNDPKEEDWYNVITINDDGSGLREIFSGVIPKIPGANGIRWMCFSDNKRILLGDYVLECSPDLDRCIHSELIPVKYPDEFNNAPGIFCRWSEIIIAPDNCHMAWTTLTMNTAVNYLAKLVRNEKNYSLKEVCVISSTELAKPDQDNEGYSTLLPVRGGEVKQFIWGGKALTMVGNGDSITESVVQPLESNEIIQITDTPGYEETTIFSPDEKMGVVMSPRFSTKTNCAIFGLIPQPHSMITRSKMINILYMYCVAGVRAFRKGNVGPVLIDIERSKKEGRKYEGVNLSDPEGRWVYYSPISWHPDSTRAMWNERTRMTEGPTKCRLRMCHLLDYTSKGAVPSFVTPDMKDIPYAKSFSLPKDQNIDEILPLMIKGKNRGRVVNSVEKAEQPVYISKYEDFSDDGKSIYNGYISVKAPSSIFAPGKTIFEADLEVKGVHNGEMKLRAVFNREGVHAPAMLSFNQGEDGKTESRGYSTYDGVTLKIEDMEI